VPFLELAEPLANFVQRMPYPGMYPPRTRTITRRRCIMVNVANFHDGPEDRVVRAAWAEGVFFSRNQNVPPAAEG
jgi:hypothetical protein